MQEHDNSELYLQASEEVDDEKQIDALWLKAMALTAGDEEKARFKYIKLRVHQLENGTSDKIKTEEKILHGKNTEEEAQDKLIIKDHIANTTILVNGDAAKKGFWKKLIGGDFGLAKTYWLFGALFNIIFNVIFRVLEHSDSLSLVLGALLVYVVYQPIVLIGIWHAADKYDGSKFWSGLARVMVVIAWLSYGVLFITFFKGMLG